MYNVLIATVSDSSYYEGSRDFTGPRLAEIFREKGYEIKDCKIVPDEREKIEQLLKEASDRDGVNLVITAGGTGFGKRDVTPEATMNVIDRYVPGFGELMRMKSYEITKNAILSRECAGIRKNTLIVNLPGSPKAAEENLSFIIDALEHGLKMINNEKNDCANMNDARQE